MIDWERVRQKALREIARNMEDNKGKSFNDWEAYKKWCNKRGMLRTPTLIESTISVTIRELEQQLATLEIGEGRS